MRVHLIALPEASASVLYGLHEVLGTAGRSSALFATSSDATLAPPTDPPACEARVVAHSRGAFRTTLGVPIEPDAAFTDAPTADVVIVPDIDLADGIPDHSEWREACDWLRRQHDAGAVICSVCTGALLLADSGLLNGRDATTHWSAARLLGERHPDIHVCVERVIVPAGSAHQVVTSGGSASWSDLALYLIARFFGQEEARRIAKIFLFGDRSDGQLPFAALVRPKQHEDAIIQKVQVWIAGHYAVAHPVWEMTRRSGLSERTFKRRFRRSTGYAPLDYVQTLRVEEAKQMLETTATRIDGIAREVGYEDANAFRRLFKRLVGISPRVYRQRFLAVTDPVCPATPAGDARLRRAPR